MKELDDDGLQEFLSKKLPPANKALTEEETKDLTAYKQLFSLLDKEPEEGPSFMFASNVRRKVQIKINKKSDRRFNVMAIVIFLISAVIAFLVITLIDPSAANNVIITVFKFKWILLIGILTFLALQVIDQKLVKRDY